MPIHMNRIAIPMSEIDDCKRPSPTTLLKQIISIYGQQKKWQKIVIPLT